MSQINPATGFPAAVNTAVTDGIVNAAVTAADNAATGALDKVSGLAPFQPEVNNAAVALIALGIKVADYYGEKALAKLLGATAAAPAKK